MSRYFAKIREALFHAFAHDVVNTAKAAAYSGMLMFFPALLVITTLVAQVERAPRWRAKRAPSSSSSCPLTLSISCSPRILTHQLHSGTVILSATLLSLFAGLGVMLSFMEGFRRAYRLPPESWTFWGRRARGLMLVFIVLVPLSLASLAIVFGHQIELWMVDNAGHDLRYFVIFFWRMVRWSVSFIAIVAVLTALYHFGTRRTEHWLWVLPGAIAGTIIWFPATLAYGWYVTSVGQLHAHLRLLCRRHRHPGLALHHLVQRPAGRGAERRPLLGAPDPTGGRKIRPRAGPRLPISPFLSPSRPAIAAFAPIPGTSSTQVLHLPPIPVSPSFHLQWNQQRPFALFHPLKNLYWPKSNCLRS